MSLYLDPKVDVVFKKIFGEHPHLLKSFLNALLPLPEDRQIVALEYLLPENIPKIPTMKYSIADVKCTDQQGRVFIVEMQIQWTDSFKQRLLFEAGQAYVKQLNRGEAYHLLQPVYGLGLVASEFDKTAEWYHHYQLVNIHSPHQAMIDQLQLIFVELPKFPVKSATEKRLRLLWLRFMREINQKTHTAPEELLAVPEIQEALHLAEEAAYTPGELEAYDRYWDAVSIEKTLIADSLHAGMAKGLKQGLKQGQQEGRQIALEEVAKRLLTQGYDMNTVADLTGLSVTCVQRL